MGGERQGHEKGKEDTDSETDGSISDDSNTFYILSRWNPRHI